MNVINPLVSIICRTYNHEKYISDAIESFLMQKTDFSIEIIIYDDASTDNTANIVRKYEKKYPSIIRPIYQKENQHSKGFNTSVGLIYSKAKGKYIASCEGDDYWTDPYKLKKQVEFLEQNTNYIATAHNVRVIDENNELVSDKLNPYKLFDEHIYTVKDAEQLRLPFQTASLVYRNIWLSISDEIIKSYLKCKTNGDHKIATLLALMGDIFCLSDMMADHRKIVSFGTSWSARTYGKNMELFEYQLVKEINLFAKRAFGIEFNNKEKRLNIITSAIIQLVRKPNKSNKEVVKKIMKISDERKEEVIKYMLFRVLNRTIRHINRVMATYKHIS